MALGFGNARRGHVLDYIFRFGLTNRIVLLGAASRAGSHSPSLVFYES